MTDILLTHLDPFRSRLVAAAQGAGAFSSQKRVRGALETFEMARKVWSYERRVEE